MKLYLLLIATPSGPMLFGLFPDPAACALVINALGLRNMAVCGAGYGRASLKSLRNTRDRANDVVKNMAVMPADCVGEGVRPHSGKSQ